MEKKGIIILFFIVVLASILRFGFLTENPPSVNWDEISYGYNAYSILKTGMDQWGSRFPIFNFRAYGDYPTTLNLYLTVPFIAVLGLTDFAIRFPHALMGVLTVISVYFLALGTTKRRNISLLASFLAAVGPWYVFASRFVIQSNLSVFLLITAAAMFVHRKKSSVLFPTSLILLFLTLFSYHTTRIFSPIFILLMAFIFRKDIKNKIIYIFVAIFIALSAYILVNPNATARGNVLFIINQSAVNKIIESRNSSKLPDSVKRFVYNRP
ncbi:MAG: phospholipid carrier-dependent glycosyltransferase, partial [Bacteroidales bacterium]|nr:phospholipid carrier-dependent glycosyltransferase [Bacteroidales bacterium]